MKKYFLRQDSSFSLNTAIPLDEIQQYRELVIEEMIKMGAVANEIKLLEDADEIIVNSIVLKRKPEDVAWAILQ